MNRKSYPERVRSALFHAIKKTAANLDACVKVPGKDFLRKRKLPLQTMLLKLICDMEWTGEAIGNIVKNALDHTQVGGIVRITWNRTPAMFQIFISDNGSGIAPEDIHHIFKRFYRSKHSIDTQGIGLGLPLAKSIIEGQGGVISVQSESGKGTLFTLSFLTEL